MNAGLMKFAPFFPRFIEQDGFTICFTDTARGPIRYTLNDEELGSPLDSVTWVDMGL